MKVYIKYILYVLLLIACIDKSKNSDVKENSLSVADINDSNERGEVFNMTKPRCLDTLLLKEWNIQYYKIKTRFRNRWKWRIEFEEKNISKELISIKYYYSSTMFDEDCEEEINIFELDSLHFKTINSIQTHTCPKRFEAIEI